MPVGSYLIELWDTVNGGTAIYPSDGFLALQINENVTGLSGGLVSSITVDDFIQQFSDLSQQLKQEVAVAIANGLKGDKGDDGLSAYQIAVINGYQGSQTEWLASLVGDKGDKGDTGAAGKDFKIVKTFPSIAEMNGDGFSDGDFTMIASDVNDPDDGKLYVWNGTSFTYVADLSGSQGIKGDTGKTGDTGEKGDPGEQGLSAYQIAVNAGFSGSVDQWLASLVGATGTVDNAGLTTAPAFVNLQTQVNNSAVGTNLFSQSTTTAGYIGGGGTIYPATSSNEIVSDYISVSASYNYAFQMWGTTPSGNSNWFGIGLYDSDKNFISRIAPTGKNQTSDTVEHVSVTLTTTSTVAYVRVSFRKFNDYKAKLEKGSVATDWSLNPSEILTESDYAKIKAAIVTLGGSLS